MKTIITIENGKISVQVDDQAPIQVAAPVPPNIPPISPPESVKPGAISILEKPVLPKGDPGCGFCRKRGSACVRHGGTDSQKYKRNTPAVSKPEFLAGHEKTPEEVEAWGKTFKPIVPGTPEYAGASRDDTEAGRRPKS